MKSEYLIVCWDWEEECIELATQLAYTASRFDQPFTIKKVETEADCAAVVFGPADMTKEDAQKYWDEY